MLTSILQAALLLLSQQSPHLVAVADAYHVQYTDESRAIGVSEQVRGQEFVRINNAYFGYADSRMMNAPAAIAATLMAHELTHTDQRRNRGMAETDYASCVAMETEAFTAEGQFWSWLWFGKLQSPANALEDEFNSIATNPSAHALTECEGLYPSHR